MKPNKMLDTRIQPAPSEQPSQVYSAPVTSPAAPASARRRAVRASEPLGPRGRDARAHATRNPVVLAFIAWAVCLPARSRRPAPKGGHATAWAACLLAPRLICPRTPTSRSSAYAISVLASLHSL